MDQFDACSLAEIFEIVGWSLGDQRNHRLEVEALEEGKVFESGICSTIHSDLDDGEPERRNNLGSHARFCPLTPTSILKNRFSLKDVHNKPVYCSSGNSFLRRPPLLSLPSLSPRLSGSPPVSPLSRLGATPFTSSLFSFGSPSQARKAMSVSQDALAAGLAAYGEEEKRLRQLIPMSMRDVVAAHASAMQAAYAAFEEYSQGEDHDDLRQQRAALEVALCRWKTPQDGVELMSVVEVREEGARLVKVNEVVDGRAAELVRDNWRALVGLFEHEWEASYKPIEDKIQAGNAYKRVEDFESEVEAAKKAAEARVKPFLEEFKLFCGMAARQDRMQQHRSKVLHTCFEQRLVEHRQSIKQELMEMLSATKDAQRRELKVVLDRAKNMEEKISDISSKTCKPDGEGKSESSQPSSLFHSTQHDDKFQALEKKIDKRFRDSSLVRESGA
eukprot:751733-Hanusia_phi.AAC.2